MIVFRLYLSLQKYLYLPIENIPKYWITDVNNEYSLHFRIKNNISRLEDNIYHPTLRKKENRKAKHTYLRHTIE
jgi:hypothetical protein